MQDNAPFLVPRLTGEVFDCTIISSQQWMLFASPAITLKWTPQGLVAEQPYTGQYGRTTGRQADDRQAGRQAAGQTGRQADRRRLSPSGDDAKDGRTDLTACLPSVLAVGFIRAAFVPDPSWKPVLQAHWRAYPSGGRVLLDYNEEDMITVQWRKKVRGGQADRPLGTHSCRHSSAQQQLHVMGLPPCCCPAADGRLLMRCAASGVCLPVCLCALARVTATRSC